MITTLYNNIYTKTKLFTKGELITCLCNFSLYRSIFPCYYMMHRIFLNRSKFQQNKREDRKEDLASCSTITTRYRLFKMQDLPIWSKRTLNLVCILAKVTSRIWIPCFIDKENYVCDFNRGRKQQ